MSQLRCRFAFTWGRFS